MRVFVVLCLLYFSALESYCQNYSVARRWNEVLLESIRNDFARPTVHARNLFHTSVALYDAWAVFDSQAETYFLGKTVHGFTCPFNGVAVPQDVDAARIEVMSYAAYRLLRHRFEGSPGESESFAFYDSLMNELGYDVSFTETNYEQGSYAALGNYLGEQLIAFGMQDGSNEIIDYENLNYSPVNEELVPMLEGNPNMIEPNRWQPLSLEIFIDQAGNVSPTSMPSFLGPEWGKVAPFALTEAELSIFQRDGDDYWVYHDPGQPPLLSLNGQTPESDLYKWNFELVSIWGSHLSSNDTMVWDISPASIGNIQSYPQTFEEHLQFYDLYNGGDIGEGHSLNPVTGLPYQPQFVKRGDYARILAEFWADGPDSETPPGHWFTILNYISDHPSLQKRFEGTGNVLSDMEWDVKSYFALGGAVHDAAVAAWGVKGWYDYVRPISAIRYMAERGQSSNNQTFNFDAQGLRLHEGYIELVEPGDELAGEWNQYAGEVKVKTWRGHDYINNPETDVAGVGWILAKNWWPYQRPSFVTPPFAGYVSGHSTFSRSAAELLTAFTGDPFFPGGMAEFEAPMNEFLVFEEGPSVDVTLQWATYRDASDQCSLSRIWGGIHPPADDIPGRLIGIEVGNNAFQLAKMYFNGNSLVTGVNSINDNALKIFPNPVRSQYLNVDLGMFDDGCKVFIYNVQGQLVMQARFQISGLVELDISNLPPGIYSLFASNGQLTSTSRIVVLSE